ncbi:sialate O-acetylesterase [Pelagicoccus albus]|uniref:Sialate O-acetylesterase domain-containing protein n=1 Tax=Pelagicoccus albus TaxID=415222 RepID=A0A7X1E8S9_9BACT|nr:sialate O-acetylesterase [Pelagicoccus albus]MBC2606453.1 hypothetical protein [Pelagicoccus albus]
MRRSLVSTLLALAAVTTSQSKDFQVYLLAGQSNMEGYGYVNELPPEYADFGNGAYIFHGNIGEDGEARDGRGLWAPLEAGHGTGFSSDGQANVLGERFGPELGFAKKLQAEASDTPVAIIKYARGGTTLDYSFGEKSGNWSVSNLGVNQYDHCLQTIRNAFSAADIDGDGETDRLIPAGIVWMQGESDGHRLDASYRYEENLAEIVSLFRAALRVDDLPVVIGRISDSGQSESGRVWEFGNVIRAQQAAYCESDPMAALVTSTDTYGYSDKWHYDSEGFMDLGEQFAAAMLSLQSE